MLLKKVSIIYVLITVIFLCLSGQISAQESAIDTSGYLPFFYNEALEFNLIIAASKGYSSEVERLILKGAEVDVETEEGATPLVFAVSNFHLQAVKMLLKYGADVNKITADRMTPLMIAVRGKNLELNRSVNNPGAELKIPFLEIAEALIRNGADLNYQDQRGVTVLNYASIYGYSDIVDLLLYYGSDIEKKSNDGTTPLMAAIWAGYTDVADLLISNGANLEARDNYGFTPFLIAAQNGDTLMMNILKKNGVDIYEKNLYNCNALGLTIKSDQRNAAEFLIKNGDKWCDPSSEAINPYDIAAKYRRKEIMGILDQYNLPSKYKSKIDQMEISISSKLNLKDIYTGFSFSFKEPLINIGFIAGIDTKLRYTKVLIKKSEALYYQYMDKSSIVYAGVFKEFSLTDNVFKSNFSLYTSLSAAYTFGNKFRGTSIVPENKYKIIPAISLKWAKNNFMLSSGIEFMNTDFYKIGPFWGRIGCSYNFNFNNIRAPIKIIKWY